MVRGDGSTFAASACLVVLSFQSRESQSTVRRSVGSRIDLLARNSAAIPISERVAHAAPLVHVKSEESNPPREKPETE